jgi:Ser/Thr protein kinase RdoA (MazF antagonist)
MTLQTAAAAPPFPLDAAEALARAALPRFGLAPDARIQFVKHRENHTYRVTDGDEVVALRVHRSGYKDDAEIASELRWIALLSAHGVPVPRVRTTSAGEPYAVVDHGGHTRRVSVQEWLDAEQTGDVVDWFEGRVRPDAELFGVLGVLAARLHDAAERIGTPAWFRRAAWDADGLAGDDPRWGVAEALGTLDASDRDLFARARSRAHRDILEVSRTTRTFGVIHADLTPENVLRRANGDHVAIDFDDFGEGYYLFDLATILWWASRLDDVAALRAALLDGYTSVRPLGPEVAALDAFVIARGSSYLGWAAARAGDEAAEWIAERVAPWARHLCAAYVAGEPLPWHPTDPREDES